MATIFLSYSRKDTDIMRQVKSALIDVGFSVWTDEGLSPGTPDWQKAIELAIRQCRGFVVILSPDAYASKWVNREISRADNFKRPIFPLLGRGTINESRPLILQTTQHLDLGNGFDKEINKLVQEFEQRGWKNLGEEIISPIIEFISPVQKEEETSKSEQISIEDISPKYLENPAMVEWIYVPKGEFIYGEDGGKRYIRKPFLIGKFPVTCLQYQRFLYANKKYSVPEGWNQANRDFPVGKQKHPVVNVSWNDAIAFCQWNRCRLPTDLEWEKAARGTAGNLYPWGNDIVGGKYANTIEAAVGDTTLVDEFPEGISPYGVWDMVGNVAEWTENWHNMKQKKYRILRGGSWQDSIYDINLENDSSYRSPHITSPGIGFRCVRSLPDDF